jgi:hypothetical protein
MILAVTTSNAVVQRESPIYAYAIGIMHQVSSGGIKNAVECSVARRPTPSDVAKIGSRAAATMMNGAPSQAESHALYYTTLYY